MNATTGHSAESVAALFGVPVDRVRAQYRKNGVQLRQMAEKARQTGRRVNGYTADQLERHATSCEQKAQ